MPKAAVWRGFVLNHLVHHRGQLSVYLRLQRRAGPGDVRAERRRSAEFLRPFAVALSTCALLGASLALFVVRRDGQRRRVSVRRFGSERRMCRPSCSRNTRRRFRATLRSFDTQGQFFVVDDLHGRDWTRDRRVHRDAVPGGVSDRDRDWSGLASLLVGSRLYPTAWLTRRARRAHHAAAITSRARA